jgi:hypothetical protein
MADVKASSGKLPLHLRKSEARALVSPYALAIMVWALDFKAAASGSAASFQAVILFIYAALFIWISVTAARQDARAGSLWVLLLWTAVFVIDSSIVGLIENQTGYAILVNVIPAFIYISAAALTLVTLTASKDRLPEFIDAVSTACLVFAAVRIAMVVVMRGTINVADSRYEVLSGSVIPSLAIIGIALVQKLSRLDVFALTFNLFVTLLSVTRTLFLILAIQLASVFVARPSVAFKSSTFKGLALLALAALVIGAVDIGTGMGLEDRWIQRMTVSQWMGADPTALTRSAETHFMMESFEATTDSLLFGNGLAAVTSLTGPDAARAARLVGWGSVNIHSVGFGHENYASILFVAGLLGGGGFLIMQFLNGLQSVALIRRIQADPVLYGDAAAHIGVWGALIVIGMLTNGFLAGTMADRDSCVWYGIGTGMLYWARGLRRKTDLAGEPGTAT